MTTALTQPLPEGVSMNFEGDESLESLPPIHERMGPGRFPGFWKPFRSLFWLIHLSFGTGCLILVLAILAAIPGLNILTLGYLIDPQKRVAESGRLSHGFPLLVLAPRLGCIVFFSLVLLTPVRIQAVRLSDAAVILGATHPRVLQMQTTLQVVQWIIAIHLMLSISRGGTVGCFFRPFRNVTWFLRSILTRKGRASMMAGTEQVLQVVRPFHHFWLGLKSFLGAIVWLLIPTGLLVAYSAPDRTAPIFGVLSFLGGVLMIPVAAWLPQLQVHQAVTGRFGSVFSIRAARQVIRNAPFSWMFATVLLYVLTLPLYLTKIKLLPADALLVLTPFFIILIYPARIVVAWAYHRGTHKSAAARWPFRLATLLVMLPLLAGYSAFLFATPLISELGKAAPLENQAFLSPVPYAQWARQSN